MRKLATIALTLLISHIWAQTNEIDETCKEYDDKIALAEAEEMPELVPYLKISCTLIKRAIGPVDHLVTIYFDEHEIEIGQPGQDVFHKEAVIRKATFSISAVSYNIHYSYYFNEGGILIKYVERQVGYGCRIIENYFGEKGVIRMKQQPLEADCEESDIDAETFDKTELTKEEKASASWILDDANKFRDILFNNYELIKN